MHLPKQSAPVQRNLPSAAITSSDGIEASISLRDLNDFLDGVEMGIDRAGRIGGALTGGLTQTLGPILPFLSLI